VTLPPFFSRVADAIRPVAEISPDALEAALGKVAIDVAFTASEPHAEAAYTLAVDLCARLYPSLRLTGPEALTENARRRVLSINPQARVSTNPLDVADENVKRIRLSIGPSAAGAGENADDGAVIQATAYGWYAAVDTDPPAWNTPPDTGHPLAWLAAAALGVGEVFRAVFAHELGERGRRHPQPGGFHLLTAASELTPDRDETGATSIDQPIDVGTTHLVGAGAIGQAVVYALAAIPVTGRLVVIDPETITLSNLQRYVLASGDDVDASKTDLVARALANSDLTVELQSCSWGDAADHLAADTVLVALDTARDRIAVAASLPQRVYNAWTQTADLGWSRHEAFGVEPCLACLYYPDRPRPSEHELIAAALGQPLLRVLAYLSYNIPIGFPLPAIPTLAELPVQPEDERWLEVSLLKDLIEAGVVDTATAPAWADETIGKVYRDGVCAGGLLAVGDLSTDVLVPLAHQSALAGVMLAAQLTAAANPNTRARRDTSIEHRYDVLRGFPQVVARPRARTPHCLCTDPIYQAALPNAGTAADG
jgi:hypothetical protein